MLQIKIFPVNPLETNCIVLWEDAGRTCAVVDPGFYRDEERSQVSAFIRENGLTPDAILLTHGHFDHTWGVADLVREFGCPVYLGADDGPQLRSGSVLMARLGLKKAVEPFDYRAVADGDLLSAGGAAWRVIATPGHTPGSVCYYCAAASVLLSGDTLFAGSIGRTDLPGGDYDDLIRSVMDKLMGLPGDTDFVPGHGQPSSLAREAAANPFLIPFNEPDTEWWNQDGLELDGLQ